MTEPRPILWFYPPVHVLVLETDRQYSYRPLREHRSWFRRYRSIGRYTLSVKNPRTIDAQVYAELYQHYAFADRLLLYQKQADPSPYRELKGPLYHAWLSRITQQRTGIYYRALLPEFSTDTPFPIRVPTYRLAYESSDTFFLARWSQPPEINETPPEDVRSIAIRSASIGLFSALNDHVRLAPRWWQIIRIDIPHEERFPQPPSRDDYEKERLLFRYHFYNLSLRRRKT